MIDMRLINRAILGALLLLLSNVPLEAQTVSDVLSMVKRHFDGISSLHSEMTIEKKLEPAYQEEVRRTAHPEIPATFTFSYWEKGNDFNYIMRKTNVGREMLVARHARLGSFDQYLTSADGGRLQLTHALRDNVWLNTDNAAFLPFGFLARMKPEERTDLWQSMPSLRDVLDPSLWSELAQSSKVSVVQNPSTPDVLTLVLKFAGRGDEERFSSSEYTYEVSLSKKNNFFPTGYVRRKSSGKIALEVQCKGLAEAVSRAGDARFVFPRETVSRSYGDKGNLLMTITSKINKVELNSIDDAEAEELFNIDPSSASVIHDMDKNVFIRVPR